MMQKENNGGFAGLVDDLISGEIERTGTLKRRIYSDCGLSRVTR